MQNIVSRHFFLFLIGFFIIFFNSLPLKAQLSPGELSQPHAFLEGIRNCTECHTAGQKISAENCLSCHTMLKERIDANKGLHANPDYQNCINCHSEHHGRDFELVHWKDGKENFNHELTGYALEGAHARQKCNDCHQPKNIAEKEKLLSKDKHRERTYLGLTTRCLSCHLDEHRGQLGNACLTCHQMEDWKPASGFDHNKTDFALTGKHRSVDCEKCHKTAQDNQFAVDKSYLKFSGFRFAQCSNCHQDAHQGRFGEDCQRCHSTSGWKSVHLTQFDHDNTRFPLKGKHRSVKCESCHLPGKPHRGLQFDQCKDCHTDHHLGQFTDRASGGACNDCHNVYSFSPSSFTLDQHQQTDFPLTGSHLAIPCIACHEGTPSGGAIATSTTTPKLNRFDFTSTRCQGCHQDRHRGTVDAYVQKDGCQHCHTVDSWQQIEFDHNQTDFALKGHHQNTACKSCHQPLNKGTPQEMIPFKKLSTKCMECHKDIHQGQFETVLVQGSATTKGTDCSRCHTVHNWQPVKFDHNRDSRFKLEGAHLEVACQRCHREIEKNGVRIALFTPLDTSCNSCHGDRSGQSDANSL